MLLEVPIYYTVYETRNKIDGKVYIGKHQTKNLDDGYLGSGRVLTRAIKKHGRENFEKRILHVFETETEMNAKEAELVTEEFCSRDDTYNLCPGGKGGWGYVNQNMTLEERSRISSMGGPKTKEGIQRIKDGYLKFFQKNGVHPNWKTAASRSFKGKHHTEESKQKMKNKLDIIVVCSVCGHSGKFHGMKRWHFRNCRTVSKEIP